MTDNIDNMDIKNKDIKNFEEAISKLEEIVKMLEEGNLSLDDALHKFEQGIKLSRYCNAHLDKAECKINMLLKGEDGSIEIKPADLAEG